MPEGRLRPRELAPIDEFRFERITGRPARFRIGNGIRDKKCWQRSAPVVTRRPSLRGASPRQQFLDQWPASQSYDKTWRRRGGSAGILLDVRLPRCWPDLLSS
jgi:hypothetical protein